MAAEGINLERFETLENCKCFYPSPYKDLKQQDFGNQMLNLLHVNARSITKNSEAIRNLIVDLDTQFTCILVSETWLNEYKFVPQMDGYNFVGMNRPGKTGGGVAIFVQKDANFKLRDDLTFAKDCLESVFVELHCEAANILVGCVYRPPSSSNEEFLHEMESIIHCVQLEHKLVFLGGDFNINLFEYGNQSTCNTFLDMLISEKLVPTISITTRLSLECESLIDNILTNCETKIQSGVIVEDSISDHFPIFNLTDVKLGLKSPKVTRTVTRIITQDRADDFICYLEEEFAQFEQHSDVDTAAAHFMEAITNNMDSFFPKKSINAKQPQKIHG